MARHSVLEHGCHRCVHFASCDTSHGSFLPQGTIVHRIVDWGKYGSLDNGMDDRTHLRQCRAAGIYRSCDEHPPMSVY